VNHVYIYNNVFHEGRTPPTGCVNRTLDFGMGDVTDINDIIVANNTFVGGWLYTFGTYMGGLSSAHVNNVIIVNNIFVDPNRLNPSGAGLDLAGDSNLSYGSWGDNVDIVFDHNVYYGKGSSNIVSQGDFQSYQYWTTLHDTQRNGSTNNPNLDASFKPTDLSVNVIKRGVNLSMYFTTDKDGKQRDPSASWDLGAFVYSSQTGGGGSGSITPPQGFRVVTQ
jgi:hypothetical protein